MVRLFVRHTVDDFESWRKVYDEFDRDRRPLGVKGDAVYQSIDDPNDVTVCHDFDSAEEARAFAGSAELREAMDRAGVRSPPEVWFVTVSG